MRKIILFIFLCIVSMITYGQSYSPNFQSPQQIQGYFDANIDKLDPIEGIYDVQFKYRTTTTLDPDWNGNFQVFVVRNPNNGEIKTYPTAAFYEEMRPEKIENLRIESIGSTNAFRLYWHESNARTFLENGSRLYAQIELTRNDHKKYARYPNLGYRIVLEYDMVKEYPTSEMYAEAAKKAAEKRAQAEIPKDWSGTGFALNNGFIVTNYHVIENAKSIKIQGVGGYFSISYNATVVALDKNNDLALLRISDSHFPGFGTIPYKVNTATSEVGEEIFVLGYPLTSTMGDEIKLTTGVISSKSGFQGDVSLYQISAPVQPGNSGGPLFDSRGNVIGVVSAKHLGAENVGYAIKASYLRNLCESASSTSILPQVNRVTSPNLSGKVKIVKNFVFYLLCSSNADISTTNNSNRTTSNSTNRTTTNNSNISTTNSPGKTTTNNSNKSITNSPNSITNGAHSNTRIESSGKTYKYPIINQSCDKSLTLISVEMRSNETILTLSFKNVLEEGRMNIDRNAYIKTIDRKYSLIGIEGIVYAPNYTYFSNKGESMTFKLRFQAIPMSTKSIDFIENDSSEWRMYGIQLNNYYQDDIVFSKDSYSQPRPLYFKNSYIYIFDFEA